MNRCLLSGLVVTLLMNAEVAWPGEIDALPDSSALQRRDNYAKNVLTHFAGHESWRANKAIRDNLGHFGGGKWHATDTGKHDHRDAGRKDFVFRVENEELRREVLSTLIKIYHDMDIFSGPSAVTISVDTALLASPEGWLKLRAHWLVDDPRLTKPRSDSPVAVRVLRVDYDFCFRPRYTPSEKQDLKRLTWVSFGRPQ